MASISYQFVSVCSGGGHTTIAVSLNGGAAQNTVYETEDIRAPLSDLTQSERDSFALILLKVHFASKTRAQISSEFQAGPVVVTV